MPSYLITGASRGLGYAFLKHLSSDPSNTVVGVVRDKPATASRLASDKLPTKNIHLLTADVTDLSALQAAAAEAAKVLPNGLDVLIHNAAFMDAVTAGLNIVEQPPQDLAESLLESFKANTIPTVFVIDSFLPLIKKGSLKKVVAISTGQGDPDAVAHFGMTVGTPYSVSKTAANMLIAKYHAAIGAKEGILFLSISPGLVDTSEGNETIRKSLDSFAKIFTDNFGDQIPDFKGPLEPSKSAEMVMKVIGGATVESLGGGLVSHYGNKTWL